MEVWTIKIEDYLTKYQKPLRFIGIFPFVMDGNELKISKYSLFLSLVIGLALSFVTFTDLLYFDLYTSNPKVLRYLQKILLTTMPITQIVNTVSLIQHKTVLASVFNTIKRIGHKLASSSKPQVQTMLPLIYSLLLIASFLLFSAECVEFEDYLTYLLYHLLAFFNYCTLQLYINTVVIIKYCFELISFSLKVKKKLLRNLNILLDCNDLLLNSCDDLNKCFGLLLLTIMTTNFCVLTVVFYQLLKINNYTAYFIGATSIWAVLISYQVLHLAWATNSTVDKAEEVKSSLIGCSYEEANEFSFLNVMLLIQNKSLTFSACGLFDINYRMVCSMAAGITTYIVVIIQMGGN